MSGLLQQIIRNGKVMKALSFVLLLMATLAFVLLGCSDDSTSVVTQNDKASTFSVGLSKGVVSGQLIAFASDRGTSFFNIYLMKSNGDKVTQLTFGNPPEYYGRPDWSPDGKKMTLTTVLEADGLKPEIYTMNADGSNKKNLSTPGFSEASRWSPDGTKIAFGMWYQNTYQTYVMNTDGSNLERVTNDPLGAHEVTWAPDSRRVAYTSGWTDYTIPVISQIHVINLDGTGDRVITNEPGGASAPAWAPRGDVILFVSNRHASPPDYVNTEIYRMNADGSGLKRLTNNTYTDLQPRWSANFSQIVFISNRDGNFELYTMNANGAGQTRITNNPAFDADPAWAIGSVEFK
jgi:Tol biopolymer transport system component